MNKAIQIENEKAPDESEENGSIHIVENRVQCIATGNEGHHGGKENGTANSRIFDLF